RGDERRLGEPDQLEPVPHSPEVPLVTDVLDAWGVVARDDALGERGSAVVTDEDDEVLVGLSEGRVDRLPDHVRAVPRRDEDGDGWHLSVSRSADGRLGDGTAEWEERALLVPQVERDSVVRQVDVVEGQH